MHLDLIHEIDYLTYLFGMPEKSQHYLSRVSSLEIDSIDSAMEEFDGEDLSEEDMRLMRVKFMSEVAN